MLRIWLSLCLLVLLVSCKGTSDEAKIRAIIQSALDGVHKKDVSQVVENAAADFRGPQELELRECKQMLFGYFYRQGWVRAFQRSLEIKVNGAQADATLVTVLAVGNPVENLADLVPTNGTTLEFHFEMRKDDGNWKFARAQYSKVE